MNADQSSYHISDKVQKVVQCIHEAAWRAGRDPQGIQLVAATKMVDADRMREAYAAGIRIFGENRLQEVQDKRSCLSDIADVAWHFIGQVQRRKIKHVVGNFALIHSVDSLGQARLMDRRAGELGVSQAVLLQVNVSGEATKGGFSVPEFTRVLPELDRLTHLDVKGLMTIPPWSEDPESARPYFRQLRELADTVQTHAYQRIRMNELSMGMSQDYGVAVEEGATLVRVGTAIFGSRNSTE